MPWPTINKRTTTTLFHGQTFLLPRSCPYKNNTVFLFIIARLYLTKQLNVMLQLDTELLRHEHRIQIATSRDCTLILQR